MILNDAAPIESTHEEDLRRCFSCDGSIIPPAPFTDGLFQLGPLILRIRTCRTCAVKLAQVPVDKEAFTRTAEVACKRYPDVMAKAFAMAL